MILSIIRVNITIVLTTLAYIPNNQDKCANCLASIGRHISHIFVLLGNALNVCILTIYVAFSNCVPLVHLYNLTSIFVLLKRRLRFYQAWVGIYGFTSSFVISYESYAIDLLKLSYTMISKPYKYIKVVEGGIHRYPYL